MIVKTIAFYNWRYPYGGGEVVTHNLGRFFRSRGMRVLLYTGELLREKLTPQDEEIFEWRPLPRGGNFCVTENREFVCSSLREERVDCIIVQGVNEFPFADVHEKTSCKVISCLHNKPFWEIDLQRRIKSSEIVNPTPVRRAEYLLLRKPVYLLTDKLRRRTIERYARMLPPIDRFVLLCDAYRREFETALTKGYAEYVPKGKLAAMLNPLLPVARQAPQPKEKIVLYAGRLVRTHKRVDRLLKIWQRIEPSHPDWRLLIVGDGEERASLEAQAARLALKRVEFMGHRTDMESFYRRASFICLTSNFEGLPMSLMEGQQYGVIPVSFDSYAGIREIACDGECGIVVPAFSLRKYAALLGAAMDDQPLRERMSARCLEAAERYSPEIIGEGWLRLFEEL